jgi:hypothetical protein
MRVAIVQSNYIPWRGYFDLIASVDKFILLDDVQYTRRDWRNRNKIRDENGVRWITIPVDTKGQYTQLICDTKVSDENWAKTHWQMLRNTYRRASQFDEVSTFIEDLYMSATSEYLSEINRHFISSVCNYLEIETILELSTDYQATGVKTDRLLDICLKAGATEYVSGPAAKGYFEEEKFAQEGIDVSWFQYGPYEDYLQPYEPFEPGLSILDNLFCNGKNANRYIVPQICK